ncbi:MAG: diguanylate cyclase [Chitinophagales bacterium]
MNDSTLILVVDDEPNNVEILEKRLKASGYMTIHAFNGQDAISLAISQKPDLIILDVMMPGISGYDVCEQLKQNRATQDIPILFLSARVEVDDRVQGLQLGAVDFVTKPFHPKELLARVVNALQQRYVLQKIKTEYEKLQAISIVDDLTGLYNRRYFLERFVEEMNRAKRYKYPVSCLMIDVDNFKTINDSYGHLAGDRVLAGISLIFRNSTRVVDLVARYGGEEFVVLLPQTDLNGALTVAEKIHSLLKECSFTFDKDTFLVTVSIGVAVSFEDKSWTIEEILRQADEALYMAKRSGRNRTVFYPGASSV